MARSLPVILLSVPLLSVAAGCARNAEFRHAAHLTVTKGACASCHGSDPAAPRPATDADCAACHRQAQEASGPGGGPYGVEKRPAAPAAGGAKFPHAAHAAAGIACLECHAAPRWKGNRFVRPTGEECSECHPADPPNAAPRPGMRRGEAASRGSVPPRKD